MKPAAGKPAAAKAATTKPAANRPVASGTAKADEATKVDKVKKMKKARAAAVPEEEVPDPLPAPRRPGLIPTDIAEALTRVLSAATASIRQHEAGSRKGGDIENVHQMRVSTRRIRAYLKAAGPALDHDSADQVRTDLKALADALGEVRDLDVMIDRLYKEAKALDGVDTAALEELIGSLDADRTKARTALVAVLDDPGHEGLLTELDATADEPPVADPWADLGELAAAQWLKLAKNRTKLHKEYGENPPDDDLHNLRIYGKRARYTAELLPKHKKVSAFLSALAVFQDVLGDHQDATVLEERLRDMVSHSGNARAGIAAGRVIERCRIRRVECRAAYPQAWKDVKKAAEAAFPDHV